MNIGDKVYIQSFKHDGSLHRTWAKGLLIDQKADEWVVVTYKTMVIESNNRIWQTREPAICFFYPNHWYNIISMIRKAGIMYYCNVASPSLYDGEALKNIDYDLDLKVFPDNSYRILDEDEFALHSQQMGYSAELIDICNNSLQQLIDLVKQKQGPFDRLLIENYYHQFLTMRHNVNFDVGT